MDAYDGCIPVTVYMVQKYVGGSIFGRWVNIKGFSDKEKAVALMSLLNFKTIKTMQTDDKYSFLAVYTEEDISASYISFENISDIYIDAKNRKVDIVTKGTDTISFHEVTLIKHVQSKQIDINFKQ